MSLWGATVTLAPQQGQRPAVGLSDATGHFQLTTLATGDGAMPGGSTVTVTKTDEAELPKNVATMSVEEMRASEALMMKGPMKRNLGLASKRVELHPHDGNLGAGRPSRLRLRGGPELSRATLR